MQLLPEAYKIYLSILKPSKLYIFELKVS